MRSRVDQHAAAESLVAYDSGVMTPARNNKIIKFDWIENRILVIFCYYNIILYTHTMITETHTFAIN